MSKKPFIIITGLILSLLSFGQEDCTDEILGYGFLTKIQGQWNGPVASTTPAGSFENWYVDFRPVSASQISQFSMLDSNTVNHISFFVVTMNNEKRIAMRTEGCFQNKCCVTYELLDSADESSGFYRFSDIVMGPKRAYTEFHFTDVIFTMKVYTNKFNKLKTQEQHATWIAKFAGNKYATEAAKRLGYPQAVSVRNFTGVFKNMTGGVLFSFENDPYKSEDQPAVGSVTVNISIDKKLKIKKTDEVCLLLTTEPLFEGIKYDKENLKYLSKYVYLTVNTKKYTIKNVHPGTYYIYSYVDTNNDKKHLSGDYMCSNVTNSFTVPDKGTTEINTTIDLVIP